MKRHGVYAAVFPIIIRAYDGGEQVLLHRRINTGYMDYKWDIAASGHIDAEETAYQAVVRECEEEIGIKVVQESLTFAFISQKVWISEGKTYFDIYFRIGEYTGTPRICESDKCNALEWFNICELPAEMIPNRKSDLQNYFEGQIYREVILE